MAKALLDSDEQVTFLFETIFDELMVDDLHGLGAHATPACGPQVDDQRELGRRLDGKLARIGYREMPAWSRIHRQRRQARKCAHH